MHKTIVEPKTGVTPRMMPSATVNAIFSGDTPWRSNWMNGWTHRCARMTATVVEVKASVYVFAQHRRAGGRSGED